MTTAVSARKRCGAAFGPIRRLSITEHMAAIAEERNDGSTPNGDQISNGTNGTLMEENHRSREIVRMPTEEDPIVTINVAGERYQTLESTLARFPTSLLGDPIKRHQFWNPRSREFFLDRHRASFESILYVYQSHGHVLRPETIPVFHFLNELKFYEFDSAVMSNFWENEGYQQPEERIMPKYRIQRLIWEFVEYPDSSIAARFVGFFSMFMVALSCVAFCMETMPIFEHINKTKQWSSPFFLIELICNCWFLLELIIRFSFCPNKFRFFRAFGNAVDALAVVPFFVSFTWSQLSEDSRDDSFAVLRAVRLIRIFQIFKLSRHSIGLRVLAQTFKASLQEIILMGVFLVIALLLFSSGIYFAEQDEPNSKFTSIPASFWFTLATITTVGFGDLVPTSSWGEVIGSLCALIGVLTLTFPISIIITNFKQFYRQAYRLASLNTEDLQRAEEEVRAWKREIAEGSVRNGLPPPLHRTDVAPMFWLTAGGSFSSADDALYM